MCAARSFPRLNSNTAQETAGRSSSGRRVVGSPCARRPAAMCLERAVPRGVQRDCEDTGCWEFAQAAEGVLGGPRVRSHGAWRPPGGGPVDKWRGSWWSQGSPEEPGKLRVLCGICEAEGASLGSGQEDVQGSQHLIDSGGWNSRSRGDGAQRVPYSLVQHGPACRRCA